MTSSRFALSPLCLSMALISLSATSFNVLAGGLDLPTLGAAQQGTSNANAAEANDPTVIFYNPAGMVRLHGIQVANSATLMAFTGKVQDLGTTGTPPPGASNTQDGKAVTNAGPAGSFWPKILGAAGLAATASVNDMVTVGFGVFAAGGGKLNYKYNWSGSNFIQDVNIEAIDINPSMAIRFDQKHSIGFGVDTVVAHAAQKVGIDVPGIAPYLLTPLVQNYNVSPGGILSNLLGATTANPLTSILSAAGVGTIPAGALVKNLSPTQQQQIAGLLGNVLLTPDSSGSARIGLVGFGFGYNAGYMFQMDDKTRFGLAYRSEVKVRLHGDLQWDIDNIKSIVDIPDPATGQMLSASDYLKRYFRPNTDANSTLTIPARISGNFFRELTDKIDVMGDFTYIQTSVNKEVAITFADQQGGADGKTTIVQGPGSVHLNWKDSYKVSLGANYHVDDKLVLRTGFQYDKSPVPDAQNRSPAAPDSDRFMYSIGAGYQINKTTHADIAYSMVVLADSLADYRDACRGVYQEQGSGLSTNAGSCTGNAGTFRARFYDTTIQVLSAQLTKKF